MHDNVHFHLPTLREFKYVQELCLCTNLYGRSTEVVLLERGIDGQAGTAPGQGTVLQVQDCTQNVTLAPHPPQITWSYSGSINIVPVYPPSPTLASSSTKHKAHNQPESSTKASTK
jgi:hypothetical protein